MGIADDVISRQTRLGEIRHPFEVSWREIQKLMFPMSSAGMFDHVLGVGNSTGMQLVNPMHERMPLIVDSTGLWALDRLSAGIESLVSPINTKWHTIGFNDVWGAQPNDMDRRWFDTQRDFLFSQRYNPKSGFRRSNQLAIRGTVAFGHGDIFVEEWYNQDGVNLPYRYCFIPTSEGYIDKNAYGDLDTFYRYYSLSARNAVRFFGRENLPEAIVADADSPVNQFKSFDFIHAVGIREENGSSLAGSVRSSRFSSYHVAVGDRKLVRESGYFSFPFIHYEWSPVAGSPYSESPAMLALADVKALQVVANMELRASQQFVDPPLALPPKGQVGRPNLNSRALNYGALTSRGELLIRPVITATAPTFAQAILESRRNAVRETLYLNLFQYLMENASMTATEALLRDQERAAILGPAGSKIQEAQGLMVERELSILERKGAYREGGPLAAPQGSQGRDFGAKFISPLDRLMGSAELVGLTRLYELAAGMAQADPSVVDNLSNDEALRKAQELLGAPAVAIVPYEKVLQLREARMQAEQGAATAQLAEQGGRAAKEVIGAIEQANAVAGQPGQTAGPRQIAGSARNPRSGRGVLGRVQR